MKEFKFRAWDKKGKNMFTINNLEIYDELDRDGFYDIDSVINNESWEVMQWTGLKDKNDKDIYEGDILKTKRQIKKFHIVEWTNPIMYGDEYGDTAGLDMGCSVYPECEVIGNIYENPEMIK